MNRAGSRLCLVEDDPIMGESLMLRFQLEGIQADWFVSAAEALVATENFDYSLLLSDIKLPDISGQEMYQTLLKRSSAPPSTLFITGFGSIDQAVELLKLGARDYITKPFDLDDLLGKLRSISPELFEFESIAGAENVLGISASMLTIQQTLRQVAGHDVSVLITGESGVGKEYVANYSHRCDKQRKQQPFEAVNCAGLVENLLEAELFGYEKGAFTGAVRKHRGVFERADGGCLFLDEIGDMPVSMQAKLLRVIQDGSLHRIGGEQAIQVNTRLISATNRDLKKAVLSGEFREDLFFRINVIHLEIPPLRDRPEDIAWFAHRFIVEYAWAHEEQHFLSPAAEDYLLSRSWPGNIRQLRHCIERACILASQEVLGPRDLGQEQFDGEEVFAVSDADLKGQLQEHEKRVILHALDVHQWRIVETAEHLGISRKNLWEKMRRYTIQPPVDLLNNSANPVDVVPE
ncbi:MAG TPA: sigma-54-dependent Fis family transcriptional regulator [Gammaproteobacteria bacterium]|nr:sigma-54-dependent Fis family transcriptional regulator [Gammaproteobacteria bacterium]